MRMRKLVATSIVGAALFVGGAGHAAPNVNVKLRVASGNYFNPVATCTLSVPESSNGIVVLETAKNAGCITSYRITYFSLGAYVDCINGTCGESGVTGRYWSMRENVNVSSTRTPVCNPTDYGVDGFRANNGDELSFTYENLTTGMTPSVCLP